MDLTLKRYLKLLGAKGNNMGHDAMQCPVCGDYIMEGRGDWKCDKCGYYYSAISGATNEPLAREKWESGETQWESGEKRRQRIEDGLKETPIEEVYHILTKYKRVGKTDYYLYLNSITNTGYIESVRRKKNGDRKKKQKTPVIESLKSAKKSFKKLGKGE